MSGQMVSTGSKNISGFSWDESTVGVSDEASKSWSVVWGWETSWGNKRSSFGGQVLSTGSNNKSGGVWVSIGTCIWVSSISISTISSPVMTISSSISSSISVPQTTISSPWVSSVGMALSGKVSSLSSDNFWGLSWGNCTVGVGDELGAGNSHACEENQEFHVCN